MKTRQDSFYTRLTLLGILMLAVGLTALGCAEDDDGDDDGNGGGTTGQIDRMAVPAVNTALIATDARKNAFNRGDPSTDVADFQTEMTANLTNLRAAVNQIPGMPAEDGSVTVGTVISIVCPDVVTIDTTQALVFPNGRQLTDDVIDPVLQLALDRTFVTDGINANDNAFLGTFPYLAAPNP